MKHKLSFSAVCLGCCIFFKPHILWASDTALPKGFEDIFNQRQSGIFDVVYGEVSIGSFSAEYDHVTVWLSSPKNIVEQLTSVDMPALKISKEQLLKQLLVPLRRVNKTGFNYKDIVVRLNESDATLQLLLPGELFKSPDEAADRTYIPYKNKAGFVHSHNFNFLSDDYGDSLGLSSNDTLNLTGNSSFRAAWSYSEDIDFNLDEFALYLENNRDRFKAGRQRMSDNLIYSTPSLSYSFFNPVSFDGISLGYMNDNYLRISDGASSPVILFMPQAGTVEIYRNGRLIDLQQFPAGVQQLNTQGWPSGGYDVQLVSKLANGSREERIQPFFKRSGAFRSGDLEYSLQLGRYDQKQGHLNNAICNGCSDREARYNTNNNHLASVALGYTTGSALSFGGGMLLDDTLMYYNTSIDVPLNFWFAERLHGDGVLGNDGSYGYQMGMSKNIYNMGLNLNYRSNRYKGNEEKYQRYGVVPAYDFDYLQLGVSTLLPFNIGASVNYSMNTVYQKYNKINKSDYNNWDVALNRDFSLNDFLNLHVDLVYHQGVSTYVSEKERRADKEINRENRIYAQFSLGMREQSYNHYQSLYLRSRFSDKGKDSNVYSADYALDLQNPNFDRGGKYTINASVNNGPNGQTSSGAGITIDNGFGYNSAGVNRSFGDNKYSQYYLSQRGGFAVGEGTASFGKMDSNTALIIDATSLPKNQYFEVRNRNTSSVVVEGGKKTTLSIQPYQKVAPMVEQVYTGDDAPEFYNLTTKSTSTWAMPGQAYKVKLTATKNQTVTGRIYSQGIPLDHARVVGGNTLTDEEGLFVGDFILDINDKITQLEVRKDGSKYICPLLDSNVRLTQGVMQIREVNCEIQ